MAYNWTGEKGAHQKSISVSKYATSLPTALFKAILRGATKALKGRFHARNAFPADQQADETDDDRLPEERFTSSDDTMHMDDSYEQAVTPGQEAACRDIPKFVKDTVIAAHNRLGHPTGKR